MKHETEKYVFMRYNEDRSKSFQSQMFVVIKWVFCYTISNQEKKYFTTSPSCEIKTVCGPLLNLMFSEKQKQYFVCLVLDGKIIHICKYHSKIKFEMALFVFKYNTNLSFAFKLFFLQLQ